MWADHGRGQGKRFRYCSSGKKSISRTRPARKIIPHVSAFHVDDREVGVRRVYDHRVTLADLTLAETRPSHTTVIDNRSPAEKRLLQIDRHGEAEAEPPIGPEFDVF
jgi:hypothetical protein